MDSEHRIQISIVVACRNEARHIVPFLESLLQQDFGDMTWEAIIADGESEDGTRELLDGFSARHPQVKVISNPERIVSTGLNAAIAAGQGEIVLRMDAHTRYAPDYCRRCVETLEQTGAENAGGPARTESKGTWGRAIAAAYHSPFSTGGGRFHQEGFEGWVDTVPYGCWRRKTFDRIGLFDETLVRNQDDEFNLRLQRAGGRIWQSPNIVSWYSPRTSLSGLFGQYFQYGFWKVAVIRKHRIPASWRHLVPGSFAAANIVLPGGAAAGLEWCGTLWLAMACLYAIANIGATVMVARNHGWRLLPYLPLIFLTYHLSYGGGFLAGLASMWFRDLHARWAQVRYSRDCRAEALMIRRLIDILASVLALLVLSPLLVLIALAVVVDSPGGPLYLGWRSGKDGRRFKMWKFRTMRVGFRRLGTITGSNDSRITHCGRLLRRTKLDELPQFVNVLLGDMTLVGPRPEEPAIVELYNAAQRRVLAVKPGITGRAQLEAGCEEDLIPEGIPADQYYVQHLMDPKLRRDLEYLETRTVWSDARVILATAALLLRGLTGRSSRRV